jgi:hypothetical protein
VESRAAWLKQDGLGRLPPTLQHRQAVQKRRTPWPATLNRSWARSALPHADGAVAANANDLRNFWFDNETGKTVAVLIISPHESGTWYWFLTRQLAADTGIPSPSTPPSTAPAFSTSSWNTRMEVIRPIPRAGIFAASAASGFTGTSRLRSSDDRDNDDSFSAEQLYPPAMAFTGGRIRGPALIWLPFLPLHSSGLRLHVPFPAEWSL